MFLQQVAADGISNYPRDAHAFFVSDFPQRNLVLRRDAQRDPVDALTGNESASF